MPPSDEPPSEELWVTSPGYTGRERRDSSRVPLTRALDDVRQLGVQIETLAERLPAVASAAQVEHRAEQVRKVLAAIVAVFVALFLSNIIFVVHLDHSIRHGHDSIRTEIGVLECLAGLSEQSKVSAPAQTLITCRQAQGGK